MPVVEVKWYAGRDETAKSHVAQAIGKAMQDVGVPAGVTHVVLHDIPRGDWVVPGQEARPTSEGREA